MGLSAIQMARMSRLLDEALPLDKGARSVWLSELAPEDQDLESALRQALLPRDGQGKGLDLLATLPTVHIHKGERSSSLKPGDRVGPYRLMRELGVGGMAEVWLAQRADGAYKREVAVKLPMLARLRKDLAPRFERERDILAGLEHPNIARLYDAGVTSEGSPYLTMEYVAGEPLTAWCDAHRLALSKRLKLFLQVLDAMQYAHDHHVIHRDLKPSNILVNQSGQVRLLDFGIAKLLSEADEDPAPQLTRMYGQALTPDYASPEQLRGEAAAEASDIYALGIVLYELLCGRPPYQLEAGASLADLGRAVADTRVQRPSEQVTDEFATLRATTRKKLARQLRGDLDTIVLKVLQRLPQARYTKVMALADDLQRYLSNEPVAARAAHMGYRLTKFVLRLCAHAAATRAYVPSPSSDPGPLRPLEDKPSIAVLPFVSMSSDAQQQYFADGITDDLTTELSRVSGLFVISRHSAFLYKGVAKAAEQIGRELGVRYLLEGSVRRAGAQLRISARLIDALLGGHLWAERYDREIQDIFALQDDVTLRIVEVLKVKLVGSETQYVGHRGTASIAAYEMLLHARERAFVFDREANETAKELYRKALEIDNSYATAHAELARAYVCDWVMDWTHEARVLDAALDHAQRAVGLAEDLSLAHAILGFVQLWRRQGDSAIAAGWRAVALDPNNADAHMYLSYSLAATNNAKEGLAQINAALRLHPHRSAYYLFSLGLCHYLMFDYAKAITALEQGLELTPAFTPNLSLLVKLYTLTGQDEEARGARARLLQCGGRGSFPSVFFLDPALAERAEEDRKLAWGE